MGEKTDRSKQVGKLRKPPEAAGAAATSKECFGWMGKVAYQQVRMSGQVA